jgi:hypothetical protein
MDTPDANITEAATLYEVHERTCPICGEGTVRMCARGEYLMSALMAALNDAVNRQRLPVKPIPRLRLREGGNVLLLIIEGLRKWESHIMQCQQCAAFEKQRVERPTPLPEEFAALTPCGIGNALILNIIRALEKGL